MKTLIVYDNNGTVFSQITGYYNLPNGINFIEFEIPKDKFVTGVDVTNKTPILEDLPKSEIQELREKLEETEGVLNFLLTGGL